MYIHCRKLLPFCSQLLGKQTVVQVPNKYNSAKAKDDLLSIPPESLYFKGNFNSAHMKAKTFFCVPSNGTSDQFWTTNCEDKCYTGATGDQHPRWPSFFSLLAVSVSEFWQRNSELCAWQASARDYLLRNNASPFRPVQSTNLIPCSNDKLPWSIFSPMLNGQQVRVRSQIWELGLSQRNQP